MSPKLLGGGALFAFLIILLSLFGFWLNSRRVSVRRITEASPELQAAIRRAKRELPEFVSAYSQATPGYRFAIKVGFDSPLGREYLWLVNPQIGPIKWSGVVDQTPMALSNLRKGRRATFTKDQVVDWMIRSPSGQTRGAYTESVLANR